MKKHIATLLTAVIMTASITGCTAEKAETQTPVTTAITAEIHIDDSADDMVVASVSGTVADITDDSITLHTENGTVTFAINSITSITGDTRVDCEVTVYYMGNISKTDELTVAEIIAGKETDDTDSASDNVTIETDETTAVTTITSETTNPVYATVSGRADEILADMTLEEKVAQMFLVRCPEENAAEIASEYQFGGYTLFAADFENEIKTSIADTIESYQNVSNVNMFIAVDEEGGTVNRVSKFSQFRAVPFWSPQNLYNEGGFDLIESDAVEKAELLGSLGINVNLAPVCDISTNPDDFIYSRSFGQSPELTSQFVTIIVSTFKDKNIACALKHFPGYGNNVDTHTGIAYDSRDYSTFTDSDFIPFEAGIKAGAEFVLVAHNIVECIDPKKPASISPAVHEILRNDLGYSGIIITDDMYMDAMLDYASSHGEAAVMAVEAGNDMICTTGYEEEIPAVVEAVNSGRISEEQINISVLRILNTKLSLGIIE